MSIKLRDVGVKDWDDILKMRNQNFRFFKEQKKRLTKKEHYDYMNSKKNDPNFHQWMVEMNNSVVGYVRLLDNDVSIMIKRGFRNKGIGSKALELLEKQARRLKIPKLIGVINSTNNSSQEIFLKNKYQLKWLIFEKKTRFQKT